MSELVAWGTGTGEIVFPASRVPSGSLVQILDGTRTGTEIERISQQKSSKYRISDFSSGGMARYGGIYTVTEGINLLAYNEGLQSRIPKQLTLPYLLTTQASVTGYNITALTAANMRIHAFLSSLGDSGLRWLGALGVRLLGDTSITDPILVSRKTFTNSITSVAEIVLNNTTYAAFASNGQTDDIIGTVDVSGSGTPSFVSLATYSSASDAIYAMWRFPQWKRTMMIGQFGGTNGVWCAKDSDAIPLTSMTPVVFTFSKDVPNPSTAIQSFGPYDARTVIANGTITNLTNLLANDTTYAERSLTGSTLVSFALIDYALDQRLPANLNTTGLTFKVNGYESGATANAFISNVQLATDIDLIGATETDIGIAKTQTLSGSTEFPTVYDPNAPFSFGGTQDRWGGNLTLSALQRADFGVLFTLTYANTVQTAYLDYAEVTVSGTLPGTQVVMNQGGWTCGGVPWSPTILPYVQPVRDNTSSLTVPTELVYITADYDSSGDRLTAEITKVPTEMKYIWHIKPYQGGVAVCGGNKASERGTLLKHVDAAGNVRNLAFPGVHGTTPVFINSLESQGEWLILDVWNTDGTDRQWWLYRNGKYYADTILQSKSDTSVAALGIPFAESTLSLQQNRIYSIFPASTNTGAARQFIPADLLADPLTLNTSEVKSMAWSGGVENTALRARTVETDFGPEEAKKSLMVISYQRRDVSASNTITVDISNDGTTTFSSPAATNTFTTALTDYNVPTAGVKYETVISRFGGKHTAAGTGTPNLLPILYTTSQQWLHLPTYDFWVDVQQMGLPDYFNLIDKMTALQGTKVTQPLKFGDRLLPATFEGFTAGEIKVPSLGYTVTADHITKPPVFRFAGTRGTAT